MIVSYNKEQHLSQLQKWWEQWHLSAYSLELLSETGLIIPETACMFLYETNSPIILFENLVCNRELSDIDRDNAVNSLVRAGKIIAKNKGFKMIMLTTNNKSILKRAEQDGSYPAEQFYIVFRGV